MVTSKAFPIDSFAKKINEVLSFGCYFCDVGVCGDVIQSFS